MKLTHVHTYYGPNPYTDEPALVATLSLSPGQQITDAAEQRLQQCYPDWGLLTGMPAGLSPLPRLAYATVRWALAALNEVRGCLRSAGVVADAGDDASGVRLFLAFHNPNVSWNALEMGAGIAFQLSQNTHFARETVQHSLEELWSLCRRHHPDFQARILMQGARAMGVPVLPASNIRSHWQYGWGARSRVMFESSSNEDGGLGTRIARSKSESKVVFAALGAPAPQHVLVHGIEELAEAARVVGWPCVTKPLDRGGGRGVSAGLENLQQLQAGFEHARRFTRGEVMVERFVPGKDHRLMVVEGRLMAAVCREPSSVTGDGRRSLNELVAEKNVSRPTHNLVGSRYLRTILLDAPALSHLAAQGLTPDAVPRAGQNVSLRSNANLSTGGVCRDVTTQLHPHVRQMAEALARGFGLYTAGVDYISPDIGRSWREVGGAFIEINVTPGLEAMVASGWEEATVARQVLGKVPGRVPLLLAVVPDEILPAVRALLEARAWQPEQGWCCDGVVQLGGLPLDVSTAPGWSDVPLLLRHRILQEALLVCGARQLQQRGLPVDRVARVDVWNVELPDPWLALLRRCADKVFSCGIWSPERMRQRLQESV